MSHSTHFSALLPLAGAVLLAVGLATPPASHAQTPPETALLGRLAPTVFIPSAKTRATASAIQGLGDPASGEQALLARTSTSHRRNPETDTADGPPVPVNGAYALLGESHALRGGPRDE